MTWDFPEVAAHFRMIDEAGVTVIALCGRAQECVEALRCLPAHERVLVGALLGGEEAGYGFGVQGVGAEAVHVSVGNATRPPRRRIRRRGRCVGAAASRWRVRALAYGVGKVNDVQDFEESPSVAVPCHRGIFGLESFALRAGPISRESLLYNRERSPLTMRKRTLTLLVLICSSMLAGRVAAQTPTAQMGSATKASGEPAPQQTALNTLHVGTRVVAEDVTVVDGRGNPVTGLPQSSFHVQDSGVAQQIRDFSELSETPTASSQTPPAGTYSNMTLVHNNGLVIVMLLDPVSIDLTDQMFLRLQMLQYLKTMPAGTPVSVFRANSEGIPVLLQSVTSDRALLKTAIDESVPTITRPGTDVFSNAIAELENISDYLRGVPGKKVLLWFGGRFPLYVDPQICATAGPVKTAGKVDPRSSGCAGLDEVRKQAFRALEQARIAVYPIDVRGVLPAGAPLRPAVGTGLMNTAGSDTIPFTPEGLKTGSQFDDEDALAQATGGRAYHSNNALAAAITSAVSNGSRSYTVVYRPEPYRDDGGWHAVRITVDGGYSVTYRRGYYAAAAQPPAQRRLSEEGVADSQPADTPPAQPVEAALSDGAPLVFSAQLRPEGKAGKSSRFQIEYTIPATELSFRTDANGSQHANFRLVALAYNSQGEVLGDAVDTVQASFTGPQMNLVTRIGTPADQSIDAAKGAEFLLLAVQDLDSQRVGTVQIPIRGAEANSGGAH